MISTQPFWFETKGDKVLIQVYNPSFVELMRVAMRRWVNRPENKN